MDNNYILTSDGELYHWKYLKREKVNGKWKYYYDTTQLKNDVNKTTTNLQNKAKSILDKAAAKTTENANKAVKNVQTKTKNTLDKAATKAIDSANKASTKVDSLVNKAKTAIGKLYDDPDNKYDVTRSSYTKKLKEIKETPEWKNIVANKNPEYVKTNSDGTSTYLIDDYLVDKKHPVLDAIGDIAAGRPVTINEITKDSIVAGLKDYATTSIELGMMAAGVVANGLTKKFKLSQGSYDEEIANLMSTANAGASYVDMILTESNTVRSMSTSDWKNVSNTTLKAVSENVNKEDVEALAAMLITASAAAKSVNEANVVDAAKLLMESEIVKENLGSNEYYKKAEATLTGLSEEEIMMIQLMLKHMSGK